MDNNLLKPNALRPNDQIALISPSSPAATFFPHRVERAKNYLESKGFRVKIMPTSTGRFMFSSPDFDT